MSTTVAEHADSCTHSPGLVDLADRGVRREARAVLYEDRRKAQQVADTIGVTVDELWHALGPVRSWWRRTR